MLDPKEVLTKFVEGNLSSSDFENEIYSNTELADLLSNEKLATENMCLDGLSTPYFYLIEQNYRDAGARLNAHDICSKVLKVLNVEFKPTTEYEAFYNLILSTQPKYLDIDPDFFEKHIYESEFKFLSKTEQRKKIKDKIKTLFQFEKKAPKWIQNPEWIIEDNKPLYFLGQYEIKKSDIFHDDGFIYLFIKKDTKEIRTIVQLY